jgi:hypothetical protein
MAASICIRYSMLMITSICNGYSVKPEVELSLNVIPKIFIPFFVTYLWKMSVIRDHMVKF